MIEEKSNPLRRPRRNVNRATVVGGTAGVGGSIAITWASVEIERRWGVPKEVAAGALGSVAAFLARWAAKLLPDV